MVANLLRGEVGRSRSGAPETDAPDLLYRWFL